MSGVFVKEGEALQEELRAAPLDAPLEWRRHFDHARRLPDRSHEGRAMHVVELVSASGGNETRYYDAETGFHVRTETRREYYGNLVPAVVSYGDYRPVDDAVLPHSIRVDYAGFEEHIMEIQEVVHAESLPRETFEPPAEVRAVMGS